MSEISDDGKRVGSRQGDDIYINDKLVAKVSGNSIKDLNGNVLALVKGDQVVDPYGNQLFELKDNAVWDHIGSKIEARAEDNDSLPAAAYYALLKNRKVK